MTLRCAILDDYQGVALAMADWQSLAPQVSVEVFRERIADRDALVRALQPFEIVCVMRERTPLPLEVIDALPNLRLIASTGGQNLSIDVAAAARRGIVVCGTTALAHPTVELTFALLLELARRPGRESEALKRGKPWQDRVGIDLAGATFGVLGLGRLGGRAATVAAAFGMPVIAWSENLTPERCAAAGIRYVSRDELFCESDVLSLHLQLSPRTHGIVGADDLARMKRTAFLINTARGELVEEEALVACLRQGGIAGAGIDVFDAEPLPLTHPFRELENVIITPHIGFVTEQNYRTYYGGVVEDIAAWLGGAPIRVATQ